MHLKVDLRRVPKVLPALLLCVILCAPITKSPKTEHLKVLITKMPLVYFAIILLNLSIQKNHTIDARCKSIWDRQTDLKNSKLSWSKQSFIVKKPMVLLDQKLRIIFIFIDIFDKTFKKVNSPSFRDMLEPNNFFIASMAFFLQFYQSRWRFGYRQCRNDMVGWLLPRRNLGYRLVCMQQPDVLRMGNLKVFIW